LLSDTIKQSWRHFAEGMVGGLAGLGVTPNMLTIAGFLLNVAVGIVLAAGYITLGGVLVLIVGLMDTFDGALARTSGQVSIFGGFLDSTLDRYSEAVIFLGLLVWYSPAGNLQINVLIYAAIVGSLMVSYARARAEGLGLDCEVGLVPRPERIALLGLGLIVGQVIAVLWVLAILTNVTAIQRIWHVRNLTKGR
jgi:CDP-diacylglycerol--glycerol-3-phosphate 3-phosphatidyltransferase